MAFVRREPTEEEIRMMNAIPRRGWEMDGVPGGGYPRKKEIVIDESENFFLFCIGGPGVKSEHYPLFFGFFWKGIYGKVDTYKQIGGKSLDKMWVKWEVIDIWYNKKQVSINQNSQLLELIKSAIIATNKCFSDFNIINNEFGVID